MARNEKLYCPDCDAAVEFPDAHEAYQRVCAAHPATPLWSSKSMFERDKKAPTNEGEMGEKAREELRQFLQGKPTDVLPGDNKEETGGAEEDKPKGWLGTMKSIMTGGAEEA